MSLREQLLKAGLVSEEKAKKVEVETRKRSHQAKKDKALAAAEATRKAERQRRLEAQAERERARDQQLNQQHEAEKKRKETGMRCRQLIASNRLNDPEADIRYNFLASGRYIRSVWVTRQQQQLLAKGRIGIVRNKENGDDFPLVSRETALKLAELSSDMVLLLHSESKDVESENEEGDV